MTAKVVTQNPRDFTVQIRRAGDGAIVGTGVIVSAEGQIVTCAHVLRSAGLEPDQEDGEITVYFPQLADEGAKSRRAAVAAYFPDHDDDVALLQLVGRPPPLKEEQVAVLGPAEPSLLQSFISYGYRPLGPYPAGYAQGKIMGVVDPPVGRDVQAGPVQLESSQINQGMSGAAVLDAERNLVVGIISETWFPPAGHKDRDTAWAINARVLSLAPLNLPLKSADLAKKSPPPPTVDVEAARQVAAAEPGTNFQAAPPPLTEWVGREALLSDLQAAFQDQARSLATLIGFGGEGKSSLARRWLDDLLDGDQAPDGVFWWSFDNRPDADAFFTEALLFLTNDNRRYVTDLKFSQQRAHALAAMLEAGRYLFVLDGLEPLQHQSGDQFGLVTDESLATFLQLCAAQQTSFCLITSRVPLFDVMNYTTHSHHDVTRLTADEGVALMQQLGVRGDPEEIEAVVVQWDSHALTLSLLAGYLIDTHGGRIDQIVAIPSPTSDEPQYDRIRRILQSYDASLSEAERAFLIIFSAFRLPVKVDALEPIFRATSELTRPLARLTDDEFRQLLDRLTAFRVVRFDPEENTYSSHILIRDHYAAFFEECPPEQRRQIYLRLAKYYYWDADKSSTLGWSLQVAGRGLAHGIKAGLPAGLAMGGIFAAAALIRDHNLREAAYFLKLAGSSLLDD